MPEAPALDLSVCLVSWRTWEDLRACLLSLGEQPGLSLEIVVVDNASGDGTVERLREAFPQARVVANETNRGFAAACNQGLALASGRYRLLLNPDTWVPPGGLAELVAWADQHPRAGLVGPQLRYPDGRLQYSCRHFPTLTAGLLRNTLLGRLFPHAASVSDYLMADWDHAQARKVDWVSGAAMLIRRELYEQIGPLDEGFFWGSEDVDYCWRAPQAGWEVWYTPTPRIVHAVGRSTDRVVTRTILRTHRSMYRLYAKHMARGPLGRALGWVGVWLRAASVLAYAWGKWLVAGGRGRRRLTP